MVPDTFVKELLSRINIVDYISEYVDLKKKGVNYSACCPFHNEKTPSFSVNERKQFYYCFGCGAGGDVISFIRAIRGYDFIEAVTELAEREGLELPDDGKPAVKIDPDSYTFMHKAAEFYKNQLSNSELAVNYCKSRGIDGDAARRFALGYASERRGDLVRQLRNIASAEQLQEVGLASRNNAERDYFFGPRLMFPIRDVRGRVVAFGARALEAGQQPKYLNSPDTKIFHKSNILYGLFEALQQDAKLEQYIVVEGYMDVIALQQAGFIGAVAAMGTAFTTSHAKIVYRHAKAIVCAFDGDSAGRRAAWKSLVNILPVLRAGTSLRFLFLPEGEDPDSLIKAQGRDAFAELLAAAQEWDDYLFQELKSKCGLETLSQKADFMAQLKELLVTMPAGMLRDMVAQKAMEFADYHPAKPANKQARPKQLRPQQPIVLAKLRKQPVRKAGPVAYALAILLYNPALLAQIGADFACFPKLQFAALWHKVVELLQANPTMNAAMLLREFVGDELAALQYLLTWSPPENADEAMISAEFKDALASIYADSVNMMIKELIARARDSELSPAQKQDLQDLLALKQKLAGTELN